MRKCCYIGALPGGCDRDAEWEVLSQKPGLAPYDCTTDACTEHVGFLLDDAEQHVITQIREG